jgi:adenine-specific DNA-methyltransferase
MVFHIKILMDEIFGADNFRNCITRKKSNPKNYTRKQYGNIADYILFYTKSSEYVWNKQVEPWTQERAREYQYVDAATGRRYMKVPVHAPGIRNGETGKAWRGMMPPPGKHWQFPPSTLDELDARGEIYWSKNGNPRRKVYLDENPGVSLQDIWLDYRDAHNQMVHISGYPTEKNINLLRRIVEASSNPGDIVLDCFAGSGTTLVAADSLGRDWIGVDNSVEAIRTMLHRFEHGTEPMGDFVGKQTPKRKAADTPLFEAPLPAEPLKPVCRLSNFTVFASRDLSASLRPMTATQDQDHPAKRKRKARAVRMET